MAHKLPELSGWIKKVRKGIRKKRPKEEKITLKQYLAREKMRNFNMRKTDKTVPRGRGN